KAIDMAFRRAVAPFQREPGGHRGVIALQTVGKILQLANAASARFLQPIVETLVLTTSYQIGKLTRQAARRRNIWRGRTKARDLGRLFPIEFLRRLQEEKGGPPG